VPQLQSIIAVTDLTRDSDACLHAAVEIAQSTGARLRVVNAMPGQLPLTEYLRLVFTPNRYAGAQANALQQQLNRVLPDTTQAEVGAHLDPTAEWVVQQARAAHAGLILVSRSVGPELITTIAERAFLPTLIVGQALELPIKRAIMPIATPVPSPEAIALAKTWAGAFSAHATDGDLHTVELELLQLVYISAASGSAAAAVRALRDSSDGKPNVKLSWRTASAEAPARQVRRLSAREDADLIITALRIKRERTAGARLSALNRSIVRTCDQPVLILPLLRRPAAAIA
jgi:nucleotide-binding universal stress UspA family protein